MHSNSQTEILAEKAIALFLKTSGATTAADAQKALNKLVAVASQAVETVVGHDAAIDMLDGVKINCSFKHTSNALAVCAPRHLNIMACAPGIQ
ncbi:TPA: hypothetical protein KDZ97_005009 [Vibrio parahaemolyticus]|uniref:hypothetical protein n=1 Tax=Vibrio parahaemolyticus TaxID=670 RepID=UPI001B83A721|nr:hypothetical protein [Vibrio parahaemolyticus]MDF5646678.1 hypothetical protein [Vibrio parahaemolyticus]MDF5666063.1 hypothetical protein [Vibrio parahaemolyticus]WKV19313.1 hypothetical protein [Vibrio parahaemolyticus]HBC3404755.1 hypothetical protein [Vibrio parahaemolyticus]HBC3540431.1 hypothetical protein [Vibrio parahaemolyticus]